MNETHCEVCRDLLVKKECQRCWNAAAVYDRLLHEVGADTGGDFVYHEIAHHVLLFRTWPRTKFHFDSIVDCLDLFSMGQAQLHELRTLALQFVTFTQLGWRPTVARLVDLSWPGIRDVDNGPVTRTDHGQLLIKTKHQAHLGVERFVPLVSQRNVKLYTNVLREFRG